VPGFCNLWSVEREYCSGGTRCTVARPHQIEAEFFRTLPRFTESMHDPRVRATQLPVAYSCTRGHGAPSYKQTCMRLVKLCQHCPCHPYANILVHRESETRADAYCDPQKSSKRTYAYCDIFQLRSEMRCCPDLSLIVRSVIQAMQISRSSAPSITTSLIGA
jgi:hypothetical protein